MNNNALQTPQDKELDLAIRDKLKSLLIKHPYPFVDLVEKCKNPKYEIRSNEEQLLKEEKWLDQSGNVPEVLKNIVLSATKPRGADMEPTSSAAKDSHNAHTVPRPGR